MKIGNQSDLQLAVPILGVNGDEEIVLLQPRGRVSLPTGFVAKDEKQRFLLVFPDPVIEPTPAPESVAPPVYRAASKGDKS